MSKKPGHMRDVVGMGIDAFTATSRDDAASTLMEKVGWQAVHQEERLGNIKHEVNYHGYKGARAGSAMCGVNTDGQVLIQLTGSTSDFWCRPLANAKIHVTRIDLQATFHVKRPSQNFGLDAITKCVDARKTEGGKHWPKPLFINAYGQGDTVYMGSRQSQKYGRLYDKGRQTSEKELRDCWRAEIEYKGETAERVWASMVHAAFAPLHAYSIVWTQYNDWLMPLPTFKGADVFIAGNGRNDTDLERKLAWVKTQVYPTMQYLSDNGYHEPLMQLMLDLDGPRDGG